MTGPRYWNPIEWLLGMEVRVPSSSGAAVGRRPQGDLPPGEAQQRANRQPLRRVARPGALARLVGLVLATVLTAACGGDGGAGNCVPCDALARTDGIGRLQFQHAGNDSTARRLIDECGFQVHNDHDGGYGDTLQVGSCLQEDGEFGIILVWAFNDFYGYRVCRPGFRGQFYHPGFTEGCRTAGSFFRP